MINEEERTPDEIRSFERRRGRGYVSWSLEHIMLG